MMKLLFPLQLAALTFALTVPPNRETWRCGSSPNLYYNGSHFTNGIDDGGVQEMDGSSNIWGSTEAVPWSRDSNNRVTINYCYDIPNDRREIKEVFEDAIDTWMEKLGQAGQASGHAVVFREVTDNTGQPLTCSDFSDKDDWNRQIPLDTLTVGFDLEGKYGDASTEGMLQRNPPEAWLNHLSVGPQKHYGVIVHELGHALGMSHEHQRPDRDTYLLVDYTKLRDMKRCMKNARDYERSITPDEVCTNYAKADKYKCDCKDYVKGRGPRGSTIQKGSDTLDTESIMMYSSFQAAFDACEYDKKRCPLLAYKDPNNHNQGTDWVDDHVSQADISDLDKEWVKSTYPYMPPP